MGVGGRCASARDGAKGRLIASGRATTRLAQVTSRAGRLLGLVRAWPSGSARRSGPRGMIADSAYLVQSQLIGLGAMPLSPPDELRPAFRRVFSNSNCFSDVIAASAGGSSPLRLTPPLFLRGLGDVCFSGRSAFLERYPACQDPGVCFERHTRQESRVAGPIGAWGQEVRLFGWDPALDDERMNHLFFELARPVRIKATHRDRTQAHGRLFVHLFPSGYVGLVSALWLHRQHLAGVGALDRALVETNPSRTDHTWSWSSEGHEGTLCQTVEWVRESIGRSLFSAPPTRSERVVPGRARSG